MLCHTSGWRWPVRHNVAYDGCLGTLLSSRFYLSAAFKEAALAWGAIKSLMKSAQACSLRLCWKDKRPHWNKSMWELKTSDAKKKKGSWRGRERLWFRWLSSQRGGQWWRGGAETPLRDFDWPVCFYHFCFVLFCFVVYRRTAVNDKRLRARYLKWASAIPPVRGYETQKQQKRRRRRSSAKTRGTFSSSATCYRPRKSTAWLGLGCGSLQLWYLKAGFPDTTLLQAFSATFALFRAQALWAERYHSTHTQ